MQVSHLFPSLLRPVPSAAAIIKSTQDPRELRRIASLLRADLAGTPAEAHERTRCRTLLAAHPACPLGVLATLERDPDSRVRQIAARSLYNPAPTPTLMPGYAP